MILTIAVLASITIVGIILFFLRIDLIQHSTKHMCPTLFQLLDCLLCRAVSDKAALNYFSSLISFANTFPFNSSDGFGAIGPAKITSIFS